MVNIISEHIDDFAFQQYPNDITVARFSDPRRESQFKQFQSQITGIV